jgi:hypothetical protein
MYRPLDCGRIERPCFLFRSWMAVSALSGLLPPLMLLALSLQMQDFRRLETYSSGWNLATGVLL